MIIFKGTVRLDSLQRLEEKQGLIGLKNIVDDWFGDVVTDSVMQAYDNYKRGLQDPLYELDVEVHDGALAALDSVKTWMPPKRGFFRRLKYLFTG